MNPAVRRSLLWGAGLLLVVLLVRAGGRFPWRETGTAMLNADLLLLAGALVIGFLTFVIKGWAWHLLLRPVAPHRWSVAQTANLLGAAVNNVSIAVVGEAVRVHRIVQEGGVPVGLAVASVVWARAIEAVGLAVFVLTAPALVTLPPLLRGLEIGAAAALVLLGVLVWFRGWSALPEFFPAPLRRAAAVLGQIGPWHRLLAPAFLAVTNWAGQWASFHLAMVATGVTAPGAASLAAVLITNLGGLLRLTPANVGVMQAGFVAALLPFGVPAAQAIAASLILQAVQIAPVMAFAVGAVGLGGLRQLSVAASEKG